MTCHEFLGANPDRNGRILLACGSFIFVVFMFLGVDRYPTTELTHSNLESVFSFSSKGSALSQFRLNDYKVYSLDGHEVYPKKDCCIQLNQANIQTLNSKILEKGTDFYHRNLDHIGLNAVSWELKNAKAQNFLYYAKLFPAQRS